MKWIVLPLLALAMLSFTNRDAEVATLKATFEYYEDGVFYFLDDEDDDYEFQAIEPKAKKKYDLASGDFDGDQFKVTYEVREEYDEDTEEDVEVRVITDLEKM